MKRKLPAPTPGILFLGLWLVAFAGTASAETRWHEVWLNGERIGALSQARVATADSVRTTEIFAVTLDRAGTPVSIRTEETHVETPDGEPLGFELDQRLGDTVARVSARRDGERWTLRAFDGRAWRDQAFTFPAGALLSEGIARLEATQREGGVRAFTYTAFDPSSLAPMTVTTTVGDETEVTTPLGPRRGIRVTQQLAMAGAVLETESWLDAAGDIVFARTPMLGTTLEVIASTEAAASRPAQGGDLFELTTVKPPRTLSHRQRARDIDWWLRVDGKVTFPARAGEQATKAVAASDCGLDADSGTTCMRVSIDLPPYRRADRSPPTEADREPNAWVQSDDPAILRFARRSTTAATDDAARMRALEQAVAARLADKNLSSAYASAREAFDDRAGDCTEHALLLAASARALGIPARVAAGLAYADDFAGMSHRLVPHAWVQAFVDGRWLGYDAALNGFDAGHLLLATGNGDPGMYFGSINALGNLSVARIVVHREAP